MIALYEAGIAGVFMLTGALVMHAGGLRRLDGLLAAPLAGAGIYLILAFALLASPLPYKPLHLLAATGMTGLLVAAAVLIARRERPRWQDGAWIAGGSLGVTAFFWLAFALIDRHTVMTHSDSFRYMQIGGMLFHDTLRDGASLGQVQARLFALPALHSIANLWNGYYLVLAQPFFAAGVISAGVLVLRKAGMDRTATVLAALFFALFLLSFNRFVMHSFYLNGHMLFALCVIAIAGAGWLMARPGPQPRAALITLQALAAVTLVLLRMEGTIMAAICLAPTLLNGRIAAPVRAGLLVVLGAAVMAWNGYVLDFYNDRGANVFGFLTGDTALRARNASSSLAFFGLGLAMAAAAPLLWLKVLTNRPLIWLAALEAGLALLLVVLVVRDPSNLLTSLAATHHNLDRHWGASWGLLVFAFLAALAFVRLPDSIHLRLPATAFIVVVFLLAYSRNNPYRIGGGDSANRMLFHIVPVMVLLVALALTHGEVRAQLKIAWAWARERWQTARARS